MDRRFFGAGLLATAAVSGCMTRPSVSRYNGPPVTSIVVNKGARKLYLLNESRILRDYEVDLGFAPAGHKRFEGDGKTPEGTYLIDRRNPRSSFHLSLGISYPNRRDRAYARAHGRSPGGEIFIHGEPNNPTDRQRASRLKDWTAGCVAVKNHEIEELWAMVPNGTVITLRA